MPKITVCGVVLYLFAMCIALFLVVRDRRARLSKGCIGTGTVTDCVRVVVFVLDV